MSEIPFLKRQREIKQAEWRALAAKAETRKAEYLRQFEGRTPSEKYRLAMERAREARKMTEEPEKR